jgi:ketosteroid isomerase-like protein
MIRHSLLAAALLVAAGCADASVAGPAAAADVAAQQGGSRRVDLRAARAALAAADRAHSDASDARGFVDGLTSAFADDAYFLRESAPLLQGREAIRTYLAASPLATARLNWTTLRADVSADGSHGYTYGGGVYTRANGTTLFTRTISYWRNEGGTWKVAAMVVNLTPVAAVPAPDGFFGDDNGVRGAPASAGLGEREAVMQADRDFAALSVAQGPAIAFRDFMAPDGATLGGPVYGPAANYELQKDGRGQLDWAPVVGEVAASGDLGFTIGLATSINPDTGARGYSKYLTVWVRQPNGDWRYTIDGGNGRPAPAS